MLLLRRRVAADDGAAGRPSRRLFAAPGTCAPPDCAESAVRSPTSPLDRWAVPALLRSPRSWDSRRVGLGGIVDDDSRADEHAANRLLGPHRMRASSSFKVLAKQSSSPASSHPKDCARPAPQLGEVGPAGGAGGGGKQVPCSKSYGDLKSGPEPVGARQPGVASSLSAGLGRFPAAGSSLPAGRYVGPVSATEVEQSEDYTCVIAHGPNPRTTRIFGDCILEPVTVPVADGESVEAMEVKEGAESYWLVKCSGEEFSSDSCFSCKEKLDGNSACIYRGDNAFCSEKCGDQEILVEEEEQNDTVMSSFSSFGSSSSFNDDIFMAGMVVLTGPIDTQLP